MCSGCVKIMCFYTAGHRWLDQEWTHKTVEIHTYYLFSWLDFFPYQKCELWDIELEWVWWFGTWVYLDLGPKLTLGQATSRGGQIYRKLEVESCRNKMLANRFWNRTDGQREAHYGQESKRSRKRDKLPLTFVSPMTLGCSSWVNYMKPPVSWKPAPLLLESLWMLCSLKPNEIGLLVFFSFK